MQNTFHRGKRRETCGIRAEATPECRQKLRRMIVLTTPADREKTGNWPNYSNRLDCCYAETLGARSLTIHKHPSTSLARAFTPRACKTLRTSRGLWGFAPSDSSLKVAPLLEAQRQTVFAERLCERAMYKTQKSSMWKAFALLHLADT